MDKVYIVETTHESGEKERREVEATHIIEAFQKGTYDRYATMVIVKEKVSRDYKTEIAYLTAENERLRGELEEQKSIAEHEHATQMEWFRNACDYKAENAEICHRSEAAEHRAEVAERAFLILWNECKEKLGWNIDCTMWYAKQAEKELTEENNND